MSPRYQVHHVCKVCRKYWGVHRGTKCPTGDTHFVLDPRYGVPEGVH